MYIILRGHSQTPSVRYRGCEYAPVCCEAADVFYAGEQFRALTGGGIVLAVGGAMIMKGMDDSHSGRDRLFTQHTFSLNLRA